MELQKPKIDLRQMDFVTCDDCGCKKFKEVTFLKRVPKLMLGSTEDTIVPFPTYACIDCGHINNELNPFEGNSSQLEL